MRAALYENLDRTVQQRVLDEAAAWKADLNHLLDEIIAGSRFEILQVVLPRTTTTSEERLARRLAGGATSSCIGFVLRGCAWQILTFINARAGTPPSNGA